MMLPRLHGKRRDKIFQSWTRLNSVVQHLMMDLALMILQVEIKHLILIQVMQAILRKEIFLLTKVPCMIQPKISKTICENLSHSLTLMVKWDQSEGAWTPPASGWFRNY